MLTILADAMLHATRQKTDVPAHLRRDVWADHYVPAARRSQPAAERRFNTRRDLSWADKT